MADEIGPVDIGRRRGDRAVDGRRQAVAIAGERSAEIGDQRMALPVGHRQKFRRHHPERQALRLVGAAGIGVVAAAEFDRGLDQEAAGIIADRAERIVVDLQPRARRLAGHRAGHRRAAIGGLLADLRRRDRQPQLPARLSGGRCRRRAARTRRRLRLGLARIEFRFLARAVERVETGVGRAAGGGQAVFRNLPDPRRRRRVALPRSCCVVGGIRAVVAGRRAAVAILRNGRSCGDTKPPAPGATGRGRQRLGLRSGPTESRQRKAWQDRA